MCGVKVTPQASLKQCSRLLGHLFDTRDTKYRKNKNRKIQKIQNTKAKYKHKYKPVSSNAPASLDTCLTPGTGNVGNTGNTRTGKNVHLKYNIVSDHIRVMIFDQWHLCLHILTWGYEYLLPPDTSTNDQIKTSDNIKL